MSSTNTKKLCLRFPRHALRVELITSVAKSATTTATLFSHLRQESNLPVHDKHFISTICRNDPKFSIKLKLSLTHTSIVSLHSHNLSNINASNEEMKLTILTDVCRREFISMLSTIGKKQFRHM